MDIPRISIPRNIINEIPPPVTSRTPPPVTTTLTPPVVDVPDPIIDYPTIDVPTREEFEEMVSQPQEETIEEGTDDARNLPPAAQTPVVDQRTVELPVVGEVPLPPVAPLVTAGATAVVAAGVTMTATIVLNQLKDTVIGPMLEQMSKKRKIKIKHKKPILHFMKMQDGVQIFEYSIDGTRLKDTTENIEQYLRDQVDINSLFEFDNKIIIDDSLSTNFTKEGKKRFKKHFIPSKALIKKLSSRFSLG